MVLKKNLIDLMQNYIKQYLDEISIEVKGKIQNQFNIEEEQFRGFTTFDFVNFYLIYTHILDDSKDDFFISIPENDYRPNFFSSIFHSLVLIKLYQNYFNYQITKPELIKRDLIYTKDRVYEVINRFDNLLKVNYKFPKKNENGLYPFHLNVQNFTKINPALRNNKNTVNNIQEYKEFLSENFGSTFPFITDFKNKTLVIAEKEFFNTSKYLPIRYTNKNGKISNDLPFFSYLIECCNDFKSAEEFLLEKNYVFDEIIVIGDSKYRDCFSEILQKAKWKGKAQNIILIGTEKPNTENQFVEWLWSNDEIKISNNEKSNLPEKIILKNELLLNVLFELKNEIDVIKNESGVNLSFLLKYTNFYFRLILVESNISKGIYKEYSERLNQYFKSDDFGQELNNLFFDKNIYNSEKISKFTERIFYKFNTISSILKKQNLKWNYIKRKAKECRNLYLVIEKRSYDTIQNQLKNERINNVKLISEKRIDNEKEYLDKWLNEQKNTENKIIILPYLNNIELFNKVKSIKGKCEVLCYEDIDEISFDNIITQYNSEERIRITHKDRSEFIKAEFSFEAEQLQRNLDDIFRFDFENENFRNNPYESIDLPKDKATYEIEFSDGTCDKFESSKGVFLIEKNELIKTTIGEIFEGATIRFYQNTNPQEFKRVLKIFDTEKMLNSFDKYSESWKETLHKLSGHFHGIEALYSNLFISDNKILYSTFRQYFDENSLTRFPRSKTLKRIKEFCLENNFGEELIVIDFEKFKIYSKKDHSIRQQAGRILGNELLDYIASNKVEKSDSLNKVPDEILEKIVVTIQEKTVKKKTLLEDE